MISSALGKFSNSRFFLENAEKFYSTFFAYFRTWNNLLWIILELVEFQIFSINVLLVNFNEKILVFRFARRITSRLITIESWDTLYKYNRSSNNAAF